MSTYYREYTLVYTCYGVTLYGSNGFIQNFSTENEAIEYIKEEQEGGIIMGNMIAEKEKFIYKCMNRTAMYDCLFAIFLFQITDERWSKYFMEYFDFIKSNSIVTTDYKHSCYHEGKMKINHTEALLDNGMVIPHEYGHFVFDKILSPKESDIIANLFKEEGTHFIKDEKYLIKLHQKYCPSITWHNFCWKRKYCPIMITDGIGILGKYTSGISHNDDYPISHLASELFAEVLEAEVMGYNIPLTIYKEECPNTYSYIRQKIYEVLNP